MKKLLLCLFGIITLGLVNFGSCEKVSNLINYIDGGTKSLNPGNNVLLSISSSDYGVYCLDINSIGVYGRSVNLTRLAYTSESPLAGNYLTIYYDQVPATYCIFVNQPYFALVNTYNDSFSIDYNIYKLSDLLSSDLPVMSSFECQQEYNLIPVSSVDSNYCEVNGLCPVCPVCPELSGGFSNFYVYSDGIYNKLSGTYNYYVNIPDYLDYSYDYSNGGDDLDLDIGVAVDTGYIENINNQQSYIPTTEDFSNVFGNIGNFGALLVVCLFVILVFYMIKKIFS